MFGRLSNWVEEQTGRDWREWVREYVISPAGLENVAAGWRDPDGGDALRMLAPPFGHDDPTDEEKAAGRSVGRPRVTPLPNSELNASSGVIASVVGLVDYSIAMMDVKVLKQPLLDEMWRAGTLKDGSTAPYGYGWYVRNWMDERSSGTGAGGRRPTPGCSCLPRTCPGR